MSAYTARNNSSSSASSRASSSASSIAAHNERRSSSITAPFKSLGRKLARHNREVTAAYEAHYGSMAGPTAATIARSAQRKSEESEMTLVSEPEKKVQEERGESTWQMLKRRAKEHNESVNNAYRIYYGAAS